MKHLKRFNEEVDVTSSKTIDSIYEDLIKSKDIVIDATGDYIKVRCKDGINIPELEELGIKKESDNVYYVSKVRKYDFGDLYSFDRESLQSLLNKPSDQIKKELEAIYNKTFNNEWYLMTLKLRELFFNYSK